MPAPSVATYSGAALVAANTTFRNLIDAGSGPGKVRVRSAADVLLADLPLTDPCGTVHGTTGQLTLTMASTGVNAIASGTAAYVEICDSANVVHLALPAAIGVSPVSGQAVFNTVAVLVDSPVDILSAVIG